MEKSRAIRQAKLPGVMSSLLRSVTDVLTKNGVDSTDALNMAESAALNFFEERHGTEIYIPLPSKLQNLARNRKIIQRYEDGMSIDELAMDYGLSESRITRILTM